MSLRLWRSRILVAVPTRGQVDASTVSRLNEIRDNTPRLPPVHFEEGHAGAGEVRNRIVHEFLGRGLDVLIMVDDDVFPPLCLLDLAGLLDVWDVVGYPTFFHKPSLGVVPNTFRYDEVQDAYRPVTGEGVQAVDAIGTGCVAVHRRVFEALGPPWFAEALHSDGALAMTDDLWFCRNARKAGLRVGADFDHWADHRVRLGLAQFVREGSRRLVVAKTLAGESAGDEVCYFCSCRYPADVLGVCPDCLSPPRT